jgi:hypothetical protein
VFIGIYAQPPEAPVLRNLKEQILLVSKISERGEWGGELSRFHEGFRRKDKVFEDSRLEQTIIPGIAHDGFFSPRHHSVAFHHSMDGRPRTVAADKRVAQFTHDTRDSPIMDVRICPAEVAEKSIDPIPLGFAGEPCVEVWMELGPGDIQARFKWHVESGDAWRSSQRPQPGRDHESNIGSFE